MKKKYEILWLTQPKPTIITASYWHQTIGSGGSPIAEFFVKPAMGNSKDEVIALVMLAHVRAIREIA